MLPVRSYSVRMKRRNMETAASFRRSQNRRRGDSSEPASPHAPARRTFSTGSVTSKTSLTRSPLVDTATSGTTSKESSTGAKTPVQDSKDVTKSLISVRLKAGRPSIIPEGEDGAAEESGDEKTTEKTAETIKEEGSNATGVESKNLTVSFSGVKTKEISLQGWGYTSTWLCVVCT